MAQVATPDKIRRLQLLLFRNNYWSARRIDQLTKFGSRSAEWSVEEHTAIPLLDKEIGPDLPRPTAQDDYILTLGYFEKHHLPDLRVRDKTTGAEIPLVARPERARILSIVFSQRVMEELRAAGAPADEIRDRMVGLAEHVQHVVHSHRDVAEAATAEFLSRCDEDTVLRLLSDETRGHLEALATTHHILVWVRGIPGDIVCLQFTHSEKNVYPDWHRTVEVVEGSKLSKKLWLYWRYLLMLQGLVAVPIRYTRSGANHARTYYFLANAEEGTEIEAFYWHSLKRRHSDGYRPMPHSSASEVLAAHSAETIIENGGGSSLDVRLDGSGMRTVWLLTLILAAVALMSRLTDLTQAEELILPLVAVVPGALLAWHSQRKSELSLRIGRLLGLELILLAAFAVLYGTVSFVDVFSSSFDDFLSDRTLAMAVGGLAAALSVVLTHICFKLRPGPSRLDELDAYLQHTDVAQYRFRRRIGATIFAVLAIATGLGWAWLIGAQDAGVPT